MIYIRKNTSTLDNDSSYDLLEEIAITNIEVPQSGGELTVSIKSDGKAKITAELSNDTPTAPQIVGQ